jgi:hypothetical protein
MLKGRRAKWLFALWEEAGDVLLVRCGGVVSSLRKVFSRISRSFSHLERYILVKGSSISHYERTILGRHRDIIRDLGLPVAWEH